MAVDQYHSQEWKSLSSAPTETENIDGSMECNICLDYAQDPVVTLCGHLYCWPCIYKWFHFQSASLASDEPPQCPVCKAEISHTTLVPLYGRGQSNIAESAGKSPYVGVGIPPRPAAIGSQALSNTTRASGQRLPYRNPYQNQHYDLQSSSTYNFHTPVFSNGAIGAADSLNPVVAMFGEMVYARMFGNTQSLYAYPNSYNVGGSGSPRLRRQEVEVTKSLSRFCIFLACCALLCLLLF